jgi:hypothetical protein
VNGSKQQMSLALQARIVIDSSLPAAHEYIY